MCLAANAVTPQLRPARIPSTKFFPSPLFLFYRITSHFPLPTSHFPLPTPG